MSEDPLREILRIESDLPTDMNLSVMSPNRAPRVSYLRLFEAASLKLHLDERSGTVSTTG